LGKSKRKVKIMEEAPEEEKQEVRGCGTKDPHSTYIEFKPSIFGLPWEYFLIDPPKPWKGGQLRSPEKFTKNGITHLALGVGKKFYPFVSDFVEEARRLGISKKVPP